MRLIDKTFHELTTTELYELLRSRSEIFVVEQTCIYQDLDSRDYDSRHLFYQEEDGSVQAYLRIFPKADEPGTLQMGRVLTLQHGKGLGGKLLHEAVSRIRQNASVREIYIEAQSYATGFYAKEGFQICSEEFLEDGIPHVQMRLHF